MEEKMVDTMGKRGYVGGYCGDSYHGYGPRCLVYLWKRVVHTDNNMFWPVIQASVLGLHLRKLGFEILIGGYWW